MKSDNLKQFVKLQSSLYAERDSIRQRLNEINRALGSIQPPSLSPAGGASTSIRTTGRRRTGRRQMSPEAKARIAAAARRRWAKAKAAGRNHL
jgi:hypothetical protein